MELRAISKRKMFLQEKSSHRQISGIDLQNGLLRLHKRSSRNSNSVIYLFAVVATITFIFNTTPGVMGQSSSSSDIKSSNNKTNNANNTPCLCGVDRVPCAKNLTSSDCPNGRVIARRDCNCCFVCAKQLTEECNNIDIPCDQDYGLECGMDKRCKAKTQCSDDTSCPSDLMCVGGACADPCKVLPDVCREASIPSGICIARNHRALCSCPPGKSLNPEKECFLTNDEVKKCESDGRQITPGEKVYKDNCKKICECESSGILNCKALEGSPTCPKSGFIPMSTISGEMSEACKILVGNDTLFDGCCVPEKCQNVKSQDKSEDSKEGRDFKLTESHNNLGEEDEKLMKVESTKEIGDASTPTGSSTTNAEAKGQITVSKRTDNLAVVELPKNKKEAMLSISLSKELNKNPGSEEVWKQHKIPAGLNQITLSDLLPNTSYTLKYSGDGNDYPSVQFITDDVPAKKKSSSAEVTFETSPSISSETSSAEMNESSEKELNLSFSGEMSSSEMGSGSGEFVTMHPDGPESSIGCLHNGTSYEMGEIFYQGCDERCECTRNGEVKCLERCSIPFFKKGALAHDKMCYEKPSGVDDCCVLYACARDSSGAGEARELIAIQVQPCDSVKCGMNAHCIGPAGMLNDEEQQTNQTLCVCNDGFIGDPYDEAQGCQQTPTPTTSSEASSSTASSLPSSTAKPEWCVFNNKTYEFGAEHFDGCNYKCRCETSGEFLCVPRCNYRRDEEKEIPSGCEVRKDPSDLECCEMLLCHGEPLESGTRKDSLTVPMDGCEYKNKTYKRDEKFYDGCDHQCMCYRNGDVTCQPRCPPAATAVASRINSGTDDCITLPDPTDKCCTVTLCGNTTLSDVMKAANESLLAASMNASTITIPKDEMTTTILPEVIPTVLPAKGEGRSSLSQTASTASESIIPIPLTIKITMVQVINTTAILVSMRIPEKDLDLLKDTPLIVQTTFDLNSWKDHPFKIKDLLKVNSNEGQIVISNLLPGKEYFFKALLNNKSESNTVSGYTSTGLSMELDEDEYPSSMESFSKESGVSQEVSVEESNSGEAIPCLYKGKTYAYNEQVYNGCEEVCICHNGGKMRCIELDCPHDGGELLDQTCLRWEPDPKFRREAPNCCPPMTCVHHSNCMVEGQLYKNFEDIPQKITGCEKSCVCEYGNVTCRELCPLMTEHPPSNLPCPKEMARAVRMQHNECCYHWVCPGPPQIPHLFGQGSSSENGSQKVTLEPTLLNKTETQIPNDLINKNESNPYINGTQIPTEMHSLFDHSHELDEERDQFIPPSTGNQPTLVSLDKIAPHQLQELLHHLSVLEGHAQREQQGQEQPGKPQREQGPPQGPQYTHAGTYIQVQTSQQVKELEKEVGAKFVEQAEDGSYILVVPNNPQDQSFSDHLGQGHQGPPYAHAVPPPGFPGAEQFPYSLGNPFQNAHPGLHDQSRVSNIVVHPLNESTMQIDFTVSPILVGLQGHVEVLYTNEFVHKPNPAQWDTKVFQQAEDLIDNTHLQLFLTNLKPDTEYHMQIKVVVVQTGVHPTSDILRVKTPPSPAPPEIFVDPEIQLTGTESRSVKLHWRKFNQVEKELIDGIQVTYKANDDKVYSTTPLIHRSLEEYEVENLQPDKEYEINLLFIPFDTNQTTILKSQKPIFVKTNPLEDEYNFDIAVKDGKITETTVELIVEGIPHPEDKFVNIYQVIYMTDSQKEQKSYFKVPKRDTGKRATLTDLKPGANYTLWLEAFLSNGKKKRSNVIAIKTKDGPLPHPEKSGQENLLNDPQATQEVPQPTSYYGALVALSIISAFSIIGIIALLMILIKKQNYAKAPINDRKSESSYDNPSFKSYDVEQNGHIKPGDL